MAPSDASQIQRIKIKPLVVIVPGAWHTAAHFGSLIHILQARGFEIIFVSLPSIGGRVESDLQSDADAVSSEVKRILGEATTLDNDSNARGPRDILVVSHSRGGAPTTLAISASQSRYNRALRGLEGGVVHLLYICAFAPFPGESVVTCFAGVRAPVKVHPNGTLLPLDAAIQLFHDVPLEEQEHYISALIPTAGKPAHGVMTNAAYLHVPATYIICEDDKLLGPLTQRWMVEGMRQAGGDVKEISMMSSHSPFISRTNEIADVIEKIVEELRSFEELQYQVPTHSSSSPRSLPPFPPLPMPRNRVESRSKRRFGGENHSLPALAGATPEIGDLAGGNMDRLSVERARRVAEEGGELGNGFWKGWRFNAVSMVCKPDDAVYHLIIYGEIFGAGMREWLENNAESEVPGLVKTIAGPYTKDPTLHPADNVSLRIDFIKYCIQDWHVPSCTSARIDCVPLLSSYPPSLTDYFALNSSPTIEFIRSPRYSVPSVHRMSTLGQRRRVNGSSTRGMEMLAAVWAAGIRENEEKNMGDKWFDEFHNYTTEWIFRRIGNSGNPWRRCVVAEPPS
ncbi:MAG: hypothetical protein TREMPRED_005241 [Tremellales sp. Tagirdzhanova-0007]|nr:MAG: hypothetical protein TREMPRED_005241 [Tremellales sp. Tagirdzhanova-0007]